MELREYRIQLSFGRLSFCCFGKLLDWEKTAKIQKQPLQQNNSPSIYSEPSANKIPIIAIHAFLDNAYSFSGIAEAWETLDLSQSIICLDLPGHGYSEHLQEKSSLCIFTYVQAILELMEYIQVQKAHLMGHSVSTVAALIAASIYPERFPALIALDGLITDYASPHAAARFYRIFYSRLLKKQNRSLEIEYQDTIEAFLEASIKQFGLSRRNSEILNKRNIKKTKLGYTWRRDPLLERPLQAPFYWTFKQCLSFITRTSANVLLLLASEDCGTASFVAYRKKVLQASKYLASAQVIYANDKGHYFHLEYPHKTAHTIYNWLAAHRYES